MPITSVDQPDLRRPGRTAHGGSRPWNRRLVLQHLLDGEAVSRAELARRTGLTPATVSALVGELEAAGLVSTAGKRHGATQVGKPPTMLQIRADARNVVALDLSDPVRLRAAVVDLAGNIVGEVTRRADEAAGAEVLRAVESMTIEALSEASSPVLGIGVGTPGVVAGDGTVVDAAQFEWSDVPLGADLAAATGLPVHVSNDANASAVAEFTHGGHGCTNLAVVRLGSGVGAGFVLDGRPYRGERQAAGEIGHLVVDPGGPRCECGHHGCLETFVAVPSIDAAVRSGVELTAVLREAAEHLGVAVAALVAILGLDRILLSGSPALFSDQFCQMVTDSLRRRCLASVASTVTVRRTNLGADDVVLGAAGLVLGHEFGVV